VAAAECWDGIPDHGEYRRLLEEGANPEAIVERVAAPGFRMADQWQAQVQAQIQQRCAVHLYSSLPAETVRRTHLSPCADIAATVTDLLAAAGPEATLCVLPQGPQTIPYLG
jgi:nickel-dependent lactate racemase